jgi:hypothetical protein
MALWRRGINLPPEEFETAYTRSLVAPKAI